MKSFTKRKKDEIDDLYYRTAILAAERIRFGDLLDEGGQAFASLAHAEPVGEGISACAPSFLLVGRDCVSRSEHLMWAPDSQGLGTQSLEP